MEIAKSIFREYDIRGVYPDQVNENAISLIAKAIAIKCDQENVREICIGCLLYTSPSPRDGTSSRMPSSA